MTKTKAAGVLILVLTAVAAVGCGPAIFSGDEAGRGAGAISNKSTWRAYGDLKDPQLAIDGSVSTFALSSSQYDNAKLIIDLQKRCLFNTIVIDHGQKNEMGFCRRIAVQISYDGVNFRQIYAASGTRRMTYLNIITPTLARYVRLVAVVPGEQPMSIAEVYLQ